MPRKVAQEEKKAPPDCVDMEKLSKCVAVAETSGCTRGSALTHNNCHGFRVKGEFLHFENKSQSHAYFKRLWKNGKYYTGCFPTEQDAKIYTGNDRADTWLKNLKKCYY